MYSPLIILFATILNDISFGMRDRYWLLNYSESAGSSLTGVYTLTLFMTPKSCIFSSSLRPISSEYGWKMK